MSSVWGRTVDGKKIHFGIDHAVGLFFDKYDNDDDAPVILLSTVLTKLDYPGLSEQLDIWLAPQEKRRLVLELARVALGVDPKPIYTSPVRGRMTADVSEAVNDVLKPTINADFDEYEDEEEEEDIPF